MRLNPTEFQTNDFRYDFAKGHLRLPPSSALLSLDVGERQSVFAILGTPTSDEPQALVEIARAWAVKVVDLGESLPGLTHHSPLPEPLIGIEEPWSPSAFDPSTPWSPSSNPRYILPDGISPDSLDDRAHRLARHDTGMAVALRSESLDSGSNSPPQVGGGPIDELTAHGHGVHRQLDFVSGDGAITLDRDLAPGLLPVDELVAAFSPADDPLSFPDECLFLPGRDMGAPPLNYDLPGACVFGIGATELRSISALRARDDWSLWEPAVRKELDHAFKTKGALTYRTSHELRAARREYPYVFEILNLVTPCVIKHDAHGNPIKRKFRITAADARSRSNSKFTAATYSGAIDGATVRYLTNATLGRNGTYRNLDVQNAYFEGRKPLPSEPGGRPLGACP